MGGSGKRSPEIARRMAGGNAVLITLQQQSNRFQVCAVHWLP
jgi:hypothetical protein